jgi:hypothetical protein
MDYLKKYEPTYEDGHWRIKTNKAIHNRFKSPGVITVTVVGILEWFVLIVRVDGTMRGL